MFPKTLAEDVTMEASLSLKNCLYIIAKKRKLGDCT